MKIKLSLLFILISAITPMLADKASDLKLDGLSFYASWKRIDRSNPRIESLVYYNPDSLKHYSDYFSIPLDDLKEIAKLQESSSKSSLDKSDNIINKNKNKFLHKAESKLLESINLNSKDAETHYFLGEVYDRLYSVSFENIILNENFDHITFLENQNKKIEQYEAALKISKKYEGDIDILGPYSKLTACWSEIAFFYELNNKHDSCIWAFKEGKKRFAFDEVILEYNRNILNCCPKNAILNVSGDNETFPIWYLQAVENIRTDVTLFNISLANLLSYLKLYKTNPPFGGKSLPFTFTNEQLSPSKSDEEDASLNYEFSDSSKYLTNEKVRESVLVRYNLSNESIKDGFTYEFKGTNYGQNRYLYKISDLSLINMFINNAFERPFCFTANCYDDFLVNFYKYYVKFGLINEVYPTQMNFYNQITLNDEFNDAYIDMNNSKSLSLKNVNDIETPNRVDLTYQTYLLDYIYNQLDVNNDIKKAEKAFNIFKSNFDFQSMEFNKYYFLIVAEKLATMDQRKSKMFEYFINTTLKKSLEEIRQKEKNIEYRNEMNIPDYKGPFFFVLNAYRLLENKKEYDRINEIFNQSKKY